MASLASRRTCPAFILGFVFLRHDTQQLDSGGPLGRVQTFGEDVCSLFVCLDILDRYAILFENFFDGSQVDVMVAEHVAELLRPSFDRDQYRCLVIFVNNQFDRSVQ